MMMSVVSANEKAKEPSFCNASKVSLSFLSAFFASLMAFLANEKAFVAHNHIKKTTLLVLHSSHLHWISKETLVFN